MAKDQDDELNTGVPGGEEFSLESILAEFGGEGGGSGKTEKKKKVTEDTIPFPMLPKSQRTAPPTGKPGRLLTFPERGADDTEPVREIVPPPAPPPEQEEDPPQQERPTRGKREAPAEKKVLDFPEEAAGPAENPLTQRINRLLQKADDYAEHMIEEEDVENDREVRRAEMTPWPW